MYILYNLKIVPIFVKNKKCMVFDDITGEGRLWAVKYDGENVNAFEQTFGQWCDLEWLTAFFVTNKEDLERYFHIRSIDRAIYDTMGDAIRLESIILDLTADSDLDTLFRPLNNLQCSEFLLGKEKAKGRRAVHHPSWLRIYALRLQKGVYLITGGAVKLTHTMQERSHTLKELEKWR